MLNLFNNEKLFRIMNERIFTTIDGVMGFGVPPPSFRGYED
jgi:hypothetical protein